MTKYHFFKLKAFAYAYMYHVFRVNISFFLQLGAFTKAPYTTLDGDLQTQMTSAMSVHVPVGLSPVMIGWRVRASDLVSLWLLLRGSAVPTVMTAEEEPMEQCGTRLLVRNVHAW